MPSEIPLAAEFLIGKHTPLSAEPYEMLFVLDGVINSFNDSECCCHSPVIATSPVKDNHISFMKVAIYGSADIYLPDRIAMRLLLDEVGGGFCLQYGVWKQTCMVFGVDRN